MQKPDIIRSSLCRGVMLGLAIHHNIFLNREQRYAIHSGIDLVVIGASSPVWFSNKRTTEPAKEIFCKYYLKNNKQEIPIKILKDGYEIHFPNRIGKIPELSNEQWRFLDQNDPAKLDQYYHRCTGEISTKSLLDFQDSGSQHLFYREHNKVKHNEQMLNVAHFVCIEDMEELINSLSAIRAIS